MVCATTMHCPTLMSMPYLHVHYSSSLPQDQHAMSMYSDIIPLISVDHACTMCTP